MWASHDNVLVVFFFNDTATTEIYTLSLHDALPISRIAIITSRLSNSPAKSAGDCCPARNEGAKTAAAQANISNTPARFGTNRISLRDLCVPASVPSVLIPRLLYGTTEISTPEGCSFDR